MFSVKQALLVVLLATSVVKAYEFDLQGFINTFPEGTLKGAAAGVFASETLKKSYQWSRAPYGLKKYLGITYLTCVGLGTAGTLGYYHKNFIRRR